MFLTGAIERCSTEITNMYALTAEGGLKDPRFEDITKFIVALRRPSVATAHYTAHDTVHDTDHVPYMIPTMIPGK